MNDIGSKIFYAILIAGVGWFVNAAYCSSPDEPDGPTQEEKAAARQSALREQLNEPGTREEVEMRLAGADERAAASRGAFENALDNPPTLQPCTGIISAQDIAKSMTLPRKATRWPFEEVGYVGMEVLITNGLKESKKLTPSRRRGPGRLLPVSFIRDGSAQSRGLLDYTEAVDAAREHVRQGMYPARDGWQDIPELELVLLLDRFTMPTVNGEEELSISRGPFTRGGRPGEAIGTAAVWSHAEGQWLCAGRFAATNAESVSMLPFPPNFREVSPEEGSRLALLYSVFADFSENLGRAVTLGVGLQEA